MDAWIEGWMNVGWVDDCMERLMDGHKMYENYDQIQCKTLSKIKNLHIYSVLSLWSLVTMSLVIRFLISFLC